MINAVNRGVLTAVCALLNLILVRPTVYLLNGSSLTYPNTSSLLSQERSTSSLASKSVRNVRI